MSTKRWSELAPLLLAVSQTWRRVIAQALSDEGLSDATGLPVLLILRHRNPMRQRDLAERLGVEGTSVVRILDSLEKLGLVRRQADGNDRRAKLLVLTEDGCAMGNRIEGIFATLRDELLGDMDTADLLATERVLNGIGERLQRRQPRR